MSTARFGLVAMLALTCACRPAPPPSGGGEKSARVETSAATDASSAAANDARPMDVDAADAAVAVAIEDAGVAAPPPDSPLQKETRDELLALFSLRPMNERERKLTGAEAFLKYAIAPGSPYAGNQGNPKIAQHLVSREKCLAGLKDVVVQTPEQKAKCGGHENMVPIWVKKDEPWFCIDVFEFPNKACELPFVWVPPTRAKAICELQGKRLCSQIEWQIACRGDPEGGPDQRYAYGSKLDLDVCHTNLKHRSPPQCSAHDAQTAWNTCGTDTEPSGAFPKCRSRFGVFDQHGNVAEVMMRRESESSVVTQLKGSAWFYVELAREPDQPIPASTPNKVGAYPDHCNFDPRWHVEPIDNAHHVNYHLGFRCCKSIP